MRLNRLLNDYEFILTDPGQFSHLNMTGDQFIRISELRVRPTNYDGYIIGIISDLTISFSDDPSIKDYSYNLSYKPGMIKGLEKLDELIIEYNLPDANKKDVFQKMVKVGSDFNFKVKNSAKLKGVSTGKTAEYKNNLLLLEKALKENEIQYELVPDSPFHLIVHLNNGLKIYTRVSSYTEQPKDTFSKIYPFIKNVIDEIEKKIDAKNCLFFFLHPNTWESEILSHSEKFGIGNISKFMDNLKTLSQIS